MTTTVILICLSIILVITIFAIRAAINPYKKPKLKKCEPVYLKLDLNCSGYTENHLKHIWPVELPEVRDIKVYYSNPVSNNKLLLLS